MEMNFKYPFFFLAGIIVVAGVTPFAMSQVGQTEPSMEIDMISGQTQNPFRIQTHDDLDVFYVDTNGKIFPEQSLMKEIIYHQEDEIVYDFGYGELPTDRSFAHAGVLAQWDIDISNKIEDETVNLQRFNSYNGDSHMVHQVWANHTSGFCAMDMEGYDKWNGWGANAYNSFSAGCSTTNCGNQEYRIQNDVWQHDVLTEVEAIRLVVYADTTPPTECKTRSVDVYSSVWIPEGVTLTREK